MDPQEDSGYYQDYEQNNYYQGYYDNDPGFQDQENEIKLSNNYSQKKQYEMKDLIRIINHEANNINELTNLGFDSSLMLYYLSGWNQQKCNELIFSGYKDLQFLKNNVSVSVQELGAKKCQVCQVCQQKSSIIFRNCCNHSFCHKCWVQYSQFKLINQFFQPFPNCMKCEVKMSYTMMNLLSSVNSCIQNLFNQVLCRNYANNNNSVKICKGIPGINCSQCFSVDNFFTILQCEKCGNILCPRCGQRSHGSTVCEINEKFKKIQKTTMGFLQYFDYQKCPKCRNAVERISGCNQMKCRCNESFCYLCGQSWNPRHSSTGADYCVNYKKIVKSIKKRKQMRRNNIESFSLKIQQIRQILFTYQQMFKFTQRFRQNLNNFIKRLLHQYNFIESQLRQLAGYCQFLKKVIGVLEGIQRQKYFEMKKDDRIEFFNKSIRQSFSKLYQFISDLELDFRILQKYDSSNSQLTGIERQRLQTQLFDQKYTQKYRKRMKDVQIPKQNIKRILKEQFQCVFLQQG